MAILQKLICLAVLWFGLIIAQSGAETLPEIIPIQNVEAFMRHKSLQNDCPDCFHVIDVAVVGERMELWKKKMAQVTPFYAVKVNNDPILLTTLAGLGACFDCASLGEIEQVMTLGVDPSCIIFAHTRKPISAIKYATQMSVKKMTFDSAEELDKMLVFAPEGEFILRIKTDDVSNGTPMSAKFGTSLDDSYSLLDTAFNQGANVIGISFHVGSSCKNAMLFEKAILEAATLFAYCQTKYGISLKILDLGGGWPSNHDERFADFADKVQVLLNAHFPKNVSVIAEPGRFFVGKTTKLAMRIIGKNTENDLNGRKNVYYATNGIYGLLAQSLYYRYDLKKLTEDEEWSIKPLFPNEGPLYSSLLWGPTCDGGDKIADEIWLPNMKSGDFIEVDNIGAYASVVETRFNQIPSSVPYYVNTGSLNDLDLNEYGSRCQSDAAAYPRNVCHPESDPLPG